MNIVQPYARMTSPQDIASPFTREDGIACLRRIEYCARISHRSEDAQTPDSWERFITSVVLKHGDHSVIEHANVTVEAVVDRGIMAEWTRHRIGAYTVESSRFVRYGTKRELPFIQPEGLDGTSAICWAYAMQDAERSYAALLEAGQAPQVARSVLPMSLATRMLVTYNLRAWRSFFLMRSTKEAHPAMRQIVLPLLQAFQETIPLLFTDISPETRQIDNLMKPR